jgi:hypothetical protein
MRRVQRQTIQRAAFAAALAAGTASAVALRQAAENLAPPPVETLYDVPPIPGDVARPLAFGFRSLLADFTFLEAIQVLAPRTANWPWQKYAGVDRRLHRLLDYSVEVDPKFAGAYRFAGAALPHETRDGKALGVLAAVSILERGARERPDVWNIPFLLGFLETYYLRDYVAAGKNLTIAAKDPGAPSYLGLLATRVTAQGGEVTTALAMAQTMLAEANEEETRREWQGRVEALEVERDLRAIEAANARFQAERGRFASSVTELLAAGFLSREPVEPHGGRYLIDADGRARSTNGGERLRIFGGAARLEVH